MSERKVLNKYFPPDFDPSKIPRCKEPRNKTFVIRLMAPCNMRCTTCGEYIYKGRKFNAKKEDVDDMNHLGLRIYRFYIKCTACLSEICFRTDPANTDYVLEAGATRNFEALAKAEKQAEEEERARQEELATNPMKLLEERTEASKNEMARVEALEELQEMNKREVKVDYEDMLARYDKMREREEARQEREDEEFVRRIFKAGGEQGESVKRLLDEDDSEEEDKIPVKTQKVERATDLLTGDKPKAKKEVWEKSIGTLGGGGAKKNGLGILVKKKAPATATSSVAKPLVKSTPAKGASSSTSTVPGPSKAPAPAEPSKPKATANSLGLVGAYSDSDESD